MALTWKILNNDLVIENGQFTTINGADEVAQRISITLGHEYNEYFLNYPGGIPWYSAILGSKDRDTVLLILRKAILDVPGVVSVLDVQLTQTGRSVAISAKAEVQDGNKTSNVFANVYGQLKES